jgi:Mg2+ and Co2+ transporter CorA
VTGRTATKDLADRLDDIRTQVQRLQQEVDALRSSIDRLQLILCGDGLQGLADRVDSLEDRVWKNDPSLITRVQSLEQHVERSNRLAWTLLALVLSQVVLGLLKLLGL